MTPKKASSSRRAVKRTVLVVLMLFVVFYLVIPQWGQQKESAELLREVNPLLVLLALGLEIAALVAYTILTRVTLPPAPRLRLFTIFRIQLSTRAVTNVVPGGSAAGGTLGYRLFTEAGVAPSAAGFAMATVGLGSAVVLNLILWLFLLISIPLNGFKPAYVTAAIVGVILLASAAALVYLLLEGRDRAEKVIRSIARRIPMVEEDTASRFVHQLADRLYDLSRQPELIRRGVLWAAVNWLLDASALWVLLLAFGTFVNPVNLIVAYGLAGVLAAIPITPGGLGLVEGALPLALVGFDVPLATATAGVLSWRFAQFWMPIPFGGLAYLSLKVGGLGQAEPETSGVGSPAAAAKQTAHRRVWDAGTGEYRVVRPEAGAALTPTADAHLAPPAPVAAIDDDSGDPLAR